MGEVCPDEVVLITRVNACRGLHDRRLEGHIARKHGGDTVEGRRIMAESRNRAFGGVGARGASRYFPEFSAIPCSISVGVKQEFENAGAGSCSYCVILCHRSG